MTATTTAIGPDRDAPVAQPAFDPEGVARIAAQVRETVYVVRGGVSLRPVDGHELVGTLAPLYPEWLGDRAFCETHQVRFPYVVGEMANGIATTTMVVAMARAEMLGFFGAAGLSPARVEAAVDELVATIGDRPNWGVNLIHSPNEPAIEERVADVSIRRGVPIVSASAFMGLTPAVIRCAVAGLRAEAGGRVVRRTRVFAKVSRPEVAARFMSPAPPELLRTLLDRGQITESEADLAARVPVAEDITVESDSGGHTDNRPLVALLPTILGLRDGIVREHGYARPVRIGAAGGLGTPQAVAGAFGLGAAYVVTGSVNQACVEAGLSAEAKAMLAQADVADVAMAPAADMFELGVRLQVLKRGTMFAARASQLYELYRTYPSLDAIPSLRRERLEREILRAPVASIWSATEAFWRDRDPSQIELAEADPRHKMALVFRWYLGNASRWAIAGTPDRRVDYQIWCGPAMGSFNRWTAGTFLAEPANRTVVQVARNLLEGAAVITRTHQLRTYGVPVPAQAFTFTPRNLT
ncbi:PfaD family polyunsaturated fatty acid/polyketide biosynthesis protein [Micromonospora sp. CB01531]|uniref:PfaD family polyunsaturated fatty acid/polyketide biosynthesis protein n=1 Tax=Micromonospora sp. CB01531 TaxID=1718947 RepID=UPI00093C7292|nr:PfaD family polyunsaturated fatty acid/polyketide biosynthesis protein [Micromonospora sp. CB01531]OKI46064.1 2-nitropropane dioxygenase [Micromonospora sp. CB01531]